MLGAIGELRGRMRKTMYCTYPTRSHPHVIMPDDVISTQAKTHDSVAILGSLGVQTQLLCRQRLERIPPRLSFRRCCCLRWSKLRHGQRSHFFSRPLFLNWRSGICVSEGPFPPAAEAPRPVEGCGRLPALLRRVKSSFSLIVVVIEVPKLSLSPLPTTRQRSSGWRSQGAPARTDRGHANPGWSSHALAGLHPLHDGTTLLGRDIR